MSDQELLRNLEESTESSEAIASKAGVAGAAVKRIRNQRSLKNQRQSTVDKLKVFFGAESPSDDSPQALLDVTHGPDIASPPLSVVNGLDEPSDENPDRIGQGNVPLNAAQVEETAGGILEATPEGYQIRKRSEVDQEVFLPVHGFVWLTKSELAVIDHPAFQRLRRISQLGQASAVYPGAGHKRFEHVLGVLHMTKRIMSALDDNHKRASLKETLADSNESCQWGEPLTELEKRLIGLAALLHDIGHLPYGHSIEDELGILNHHDKENRLRLVIEEYKASPFQSFTLKELILKDYKLDKSTLDSIRAEVNAIDLVISIILHAPTRDLTREYTKLVENDQDGSGDLVTKEEILRRFAQDLCGLGVRLQVCADIVGNTICADLLDYLHRDWHHVGKSQYLEDRALHYMEIRRKPHVVGEPVQMGIGPEDRFVMNLGRYPRLRTDCVSLILELLENRYNLAEAVLFHRAKLKLTAMLERCLSLTFDIPDAPKHGEIENRPLEEALLGMSEDSFLDELCKVKPTIMKRMLTQEEDGQRLFLAHSIRDRQLFRHVHTISYSEARPEAVVRFQELYAECKSASRNREQALVQLEADFALKRGELVMYCPRAKMNTKIAEVTVLIGGEMHRLDEYDEKSTPKLAAGHLAAQVERFRNLWLVTFLVDPRVQRRFSMNDVDFKKWREMLAEYIQAFVIGTSQGKDIMRARAMVVERMATSPMFLTTHGIDGPAIEVEDVPLKGVARAEEVPHRGIATRNNAPGTYPNGAESFWHYRSRPK